MYRIDQTANQVEKLKSRQFGELNLKERQHLQEWIAKNPDMLGEELLIIQKEFDGFSDTSERLDLLALDKDGALVIIENKLDDTGRDVVWQALKYTAYCSTLTTDQIIEIYQAYLDKYEEGEDAKSSIQAFLGYEESEDEIHLNNTDQRVILVANNFRREVTATVLWLIGRGVDIKCIKASPFSLGNELLLQVDQIIPVPEAEEYLIQIKNKEEENKRKSRGETDGGKRMYRFWSQFKAYASEENNSFFDQRNPVAKSSFGFRRDGGKYFCCLAQNNARVELYLSHSNHKEHFALLKGHKVEIEEAFGESLTWEELLGRKASRIKFNMPEEMQELFVKHFRKEEKWDVFIEWYLNSMVRFYEALHPFVKKVVNL